MEEALDANMLSLSCWDSSSSRALVLSCATDQIGTLAEEFRALLRIMLLNT